MLKSKMRWQLPQKTTDSVEALAGELNVSTVTAQLLINRKITTVSEASAFLHTHQIDRHDPFHLQGMEAAVDRIHQAVANQEAILVFGDYDADGVSSTALMIETLRELGAVFSWYIPNRFHEGYGPNVPALRQAYEEGAGLIITVDTGVSASEVIQEATSWGLDVIVTDHHEPPPVLPECTIINPKQPGCPYPFKELAGVGVAYKLASALLSREPEEWLDLVAIGTISDLVPLTGENRYFAKQGLSRLSRLARPGVAALKEVSGIQETELNADHVGFAFGPRLNAAGRLDSADPAVHLLVTEDVEEAKEWALTIDSYNKERKEIVDKICKEAIEEVESKGDPDKRGAIIVAKEGWNPGVIGIVASRLVERYYRPVIVLAIDPAANEAKGSARSIEGFDMFNELSKSRELLPHFGGHPMAAGLTMDPADISLLSERLNYQALSTLSEEEFIPLTAVDAVLSVEEATLPLIEEVESLAPYGMGNPKPKVVFKDVHISQMRKIGSDMNHLKLTLTKQQAEVEAIGFQFGYLHEELDQQTPVSAMGELSINEWNGFRKPQLILRDMSVATWQLFDYRNQANALASFKVSQDEKLVPILFQSENQGLIQDAAWFKNVLLVDPDEKLPQIEEGSHLLFIDMPQTMQQLRAVFQGCKGLPGRIYAIFHRDEDLYFETQPTREHFKWYYGFLKQRESFDVRKHAEELAKHKGWSKRTITFMTQVFFELEFVTMDGGVVKVCSNPVSQGLEDSRTYQSVKERLDLEQQLIFSTKEELKQMIDKFVDEKTEGEEKVGHGL
nr:single-stranded-DNA-specific exonuclease RecJ [Salsuginibacillus kocurii]